MLKWLKSPPIDPTVSRLRCLSTSLNGHRCMKAQGHSDLHAANIGNIFQAVRWGVKLDK